MAKNTRNTTDPSLLRLDKLRERCTQSIGSFEKERNAKVLHTRDGDQYFIDRDARILGVAHLDTVSRSDHFAMAKLRGKHTIFCETLDDRLGVHILLDVLPRLGIKFDILLTQGEEKGMSTAFHFRTDKEYRWMFSFDRAGTDVVLYQYLAQYRGLIKEHTKLTPAHGSYSDIVDLEHLGIAGFNWGTGYYDNHTMMSHCIIAHTEYMIAQFVRFYHKMARKTLPYDPRTSQPLFDRHSNKYTLLYGTHTLGTCICCGYDDMEIDEYHLCVSCRLEMRGCYDESDYQGEI